MALLESWGSYSKVFGGGLILLTPPRLELHKSGFDRWGTSRLPAGDWDNPELLLFPIINPTNDDDGDDDDIEEEIIVTIIGIIIRLENF